MTPIWNLTLDSSPKSEVFTPTPHSTESDNIILSNYFPEK